MASNSHGRVRNADVYACETLDATWSGRIRTRKYCTGIKRNWFYGARWYIGTVNRVLGGDEDGVFARRFVTQKWLAPFLDFDEKFEKKKWLAPFLGQAYASMANRYSNWRTVTQTVRMATDGYKIYFGGKKTA